MLDLVNLDAETRKYMLAEIDLDMGKNELFLSERLSATASLAYPGVLKTAVQQHDDDWLSNQLRQLGFRAMEFYTKNGKTMERKVPSNAAETLAEGEFNRFYLRGLCCRTIEAGGDELIIYRAKVVAKARPESEAKLGDSVSASELLRDLRNHIGIDTALGLPAGPNSGLSAMLPQ